MTENELIESLMKLHKCADCPLRCNAMKRPHSIFARIHRWHKTWWPGWTLYLKEQFAGQQPGEDHRDRPGAWDWPAGHLHGPVGRAGGSGRLSQPPPAEGGR